MARRPSYLMLEFLYQTHWRLSKARECPGIHERVRQLGEEAHLTPEAWQEQCRKRLHAVVTFAQSNVPYYRDALKRAGFDVSRAVSATESACIPILTKDLIRKCLHDLVAEVADRRRMIPNATGGSTGTPVDFYQDLDVKAISDAIDVDVRRWWGVKPYDRTVLVWVPTGSFIRSRGKNVSTTGGCGRARSTRSA